MPSEVGVRIRGLRELNRAMARADATVRKDFKKTLKEVAEPVRARAHELAVSEIRNIGDRWSGMRIGATSKVVYVAPTQRGGRGNSRPNLASLLMDRAMQPALDENAPLIEQRVGVFLDRIATDWEH